MINKYEFALRGAEKVPPPTPTLRVVIGVLKGYDQLMNLVLDSVEEYLRGPFVLELD